MSGTKIKRGDTVEVIRGDAKIKGQRGKVLRVLPKKNAVVIENVNYVFKHLRRSQEHPRGGRVEKEAPIDISNVMLVCPETNKRTRVGYKFVEEAGKQVKKRVCKISGAVLD